MADELPRNSKEMDLQAPRAAGLLPYYYKDQQNMQMYEQTKKRLEVLVQTTK